MRNLVHKGFAPLLLYGVSQFVAVSVQAATTDRFSIVANGEIVGHLVSVQNGRSIDVDYAVSDNGRGPKHKEHLLLDAAGIPLQWSIEGDIVDGVAPSASTSAGKTVWKAG